jgi:hypothetical protein
LDGDDRSSGDVGGEIYGCTAAGRSEFECAAGDVADEIDGVCGQPSATGDGGEDDGLVCRVYMTGRSDDIRGGIACDGVWDNSIFYDEAGGLQDCAVRAVCAEDGVVNGACGERAWECVCDHGFLAVGK